MASNGFWNGFSFGMGFELMRRVLVPVIVIWLSLLCWWWLGPEKPRCNSARREVAQRVVSQVAKSLRAVSHDIYRIDVIHFTNDSTDFLTQTLRKELMESGRFDLSGTPILEKLRNFLNLRNEGEFDVEKALKLAKRKQLDGIVIGQLQRFELTAEGVVLEGVLKLILADSGEVLEFPLLSHPPKMMQGEKSHDVESTLSKLSVWERVGFVVLVVFILPMIFIPLIKTVLIKESNGAILSVLVLITVLDGIIIRLLMGNEGFCGSGLTFCILLLSAILFNLFTFSFIRLRLPLRPGEY